MGRDIRIRYDRLLSESHHGQPQLVWEVHPEGRGRPSIVIDPDFLRWAYTMRTVASIARFLGVGRSTVTKNLLVYGIRERQDAPFQFQSAQPAGDTDESGASTTADHASVQDDILDPALPMPDSLPEVTSYTGAHAVSVRPNP